MVIFIHIQSVSRDNSVDIYYDRNVYRVSYADGIDSEEIEVPAAAEYRFEKTVELDFNVGVRQGYVFTGWTDGTTLYTAAGTNSLVIGTDNVELTAVFSRNSYKLIYKDGVENENIDIPDSESHLYEETVSIKFNIGERPGYSFIGWTDGTTLYTATGTNSLVIGTKDIELTAVWSTSIVTVTVEPNSDISLIVSQNGTMFTFTADSTYSDFTWAIDGTVQGETSNIFEIETAAWLKGVYEVTVEAQINGEWRSATVKISVEGK